MKQSKYQHNLSLQSPILLDQEYKRPKVEKMLAILRNAGAISTDEKLLSLDIGCSGGFFSTALTPYFKEVIGLDIDMNALELAKKNNKAKNLNYFAGDSLNLPFVDNSIDLIVCNHIYEHVPDPVKMFDEIYRVLKNDGICYFGAVSRLVIDEPHYHLPFLSWFPKFLAHYYMRLFSKGDYYYETLRTFGGINKLVTKFTVYDYTLKIILEPDKYNARDLIPKNSVLSKIPQFVWKMFYRILPTYILILRK